MAFLPNFGPVGEVRKAAQVMGDVSSLEKGVPATAGRVKHRVLGKAGGRPLVTFNIVGLVFWTEFMVWLRNHVLQANLEDVWVGSVASYAPYYEYGLFSRETTGGSKRLTGGEATGGHRHVRMLADAIEDVFREQQLPQDTGTSQHKDLRSGIYKAGQFFSDAQSLVKGKIGGRVARRAAGRSTSAFFLGTLTNPELNYNEVLAKQVLRKVRRRIRDEDLIDTGALLASFQMGSTMGQMEAKSIAAMGRALNQAGFLDQLGKRIGKIG